MQVLTAQEMRAIDQQAIKLGIPSLVLMENAGVAVVNCLKEWFGSLTDKRIHILVGKGNNGGDGLVIARHLLNQGVRVKVYVLGNENELSPDCNHNYQLFKKLNGEIRVLTEQSLPKLKFSLSLADIVIDAMLGTGSTGSLQGIYHQVVELVNQVNRPVVAVDTPTGVDATTGNVGSVAVRASYTVVLGFMKQGLLLFPGADYVGQYQVVDIGIPHSLAGKIERYLTTEQFKAKLPQRPLWGHKGTFGHGLVIAGSRTMAGSAYLASYAMLRAGAGMVTLAVPQSIADSFPPGEVMVQPIADTAQGTLGISSIPQLVKLFERKDVLVFGPGLGRGEEIGQLVWEIINQWQGSMVLDADGLNSLKGRLADFTSISASQRQKWVFTPHPGEMVRLTGLDIPQINRERPQVTWQAQEQLGVTMLLKGVPTVIAGGKQLFFNTTGNPGMGTAGMGDVLAGIIGGLLCQGMSPLDSAVLGAYVHGRAGDLVAADQGQRGMVASDILAVLPNLLN